MKICFYMIALFLLAFVTVTGQKNESWRYNCREQCKQKYNTCLQESQGDGPKKEQCERNYKGCQYYCAHPPRKA